MGKKNFADFLRHTLTHGAITGVIMSVLLFIFGQNGIDPITGEGESIITSLVVGIVLAVGLFKSQSSMKIKNPETKFGMLTLCGIITGLGVGIITSLYLSYYCKTGDLTTFYTSLEKSGEILSKSGHFHKDEVESAMEMSKKLLVPMILIINIIGYVFKAAIMSLIGALFISRLNIIKKS